MSNLLQQSLDQILQEKLSKIIPENIRKGVTVFNVEGTLENTGPGPSLTGKISLFETTEEMNQSSGNVDGDLALVYANSVGKASANQTIKTVTFPSSVHLDSAVTDYASWYPTVDPDYMVDISLSESSFNFMIDNMMARRKY